ncbi:hypothetical protein EIQ06_16780 [Xanthomonas campestris pv. campestris]|uniref:Uncharacterized protein n=1 Tax=Xanthomonas campestris pv. campestris (strain 8004) TaxID=314565 RepID=A0A0H2XBT0_XANC8|nr:hypothetical protein [Xanthomonas campestris]AAY50234.1 conserved hypothetical protein [Xanthomonas campestris pv. campestris str. 8004]QCX69207.1 hypothetical protein DFG55_13820 [Xanthomonas campestris pv. campestris]QCX73573.1 hypothetical protein DFG54_16605 [Xanthomonas campestris pv. campestris]
MQGSFRLHDESAAEPFSPSTSCLTAYPHAATVRSTGSLRSRMPVKKLTHCIVAVALVPIMTLGCARLSTGDAAAKPLHTAGGASSFPRASAMSPSPWVPFKLERQMGAVCVDRMQSQGSSPAPLLRDGFCKGPAPAHIVRALLALPASAVDASPQAREASLRDAVYVAAPGLGRRADFTVAAGDLTIRSFESAEPDKTVYVVWSVKCGPGEAGLACQSGKGRKAYRLGKDGTAHDVSALVFPPVPSLSAQDIARQNDHGGSELFLFDDKLPVASTMRWLMEFDPDQPLASDDPKRVGSYAHFGFLRWTGERFELVERVPRAQWPCRQQRTGQPACSDYPDGEDRFISE